MKNNEEEEEDDNYPEFPEYGDTFMGEAEGGAEGEAHDEPPDDLGVGGMTPGRVERLERCRDMVDYICRLTK
jgi:hypothetical protein